MKLLTLEKESSLGSLWDQEQCAQFCLKDELWEAAKEEEMKIPWKEAQEGLPSLLAMSRLFNALPTADAILVSTSADAILV